MFLSKIVNFIKSSIEEAKKLEIPSKKETYVMTVIILITVIASSLFILSIDLVISKIISFVFGL